VSALRDDDCPAQGRPSSFTARRADRRAILSVGRCDVGGVADQEGVS